MELNADGRRDSSFLGMTRFLHGAVVAAILSPEEAPKAARTATFLRLGFVRMAFGFLARTTSDYL